MENTFNLSRLVQLCVSGFLRVHCIEMSEFVQSKQQHSNRSYVEVSSIKMSQWNLRTKELMDWLLNQPVSTDVKANEMSMLH
eukprot:1691729-Amphidinium_carterae.1